MKRHRPEKNAQPKGETSEAEAGFADAKMLERAAATRDAWLADQEILKDFYAHVVLQDTDLGLPSIQSTLPGWLNARLLEAYSAGYGHASIRVAGLTVELERLKGTCQGFLDEALQFRTALETIHKESRQASDEDRRAWMVADEALRPGA